MKMIVAVSSLGKDLDSLVSPSFGRSPYFIFVSIENNKIVNWEAIKNQYANAFGGAGIATAQLIANKKASVVLTGNVGPNAFFALSSSGIKIYFAANMKVKDAIESFLRGELKEMEGAGRRRGWDRRW